MSVADVDTTSMKRTTEAAFETVIEAHLLDNGYMPVAREGFDRDRAIFPEEALAFIRGTQPMEWARLERLHGDRTGEQILGDLCKWMDQHGSLATLRHGFKCYGRTLRVAFFKAAHELNPELEARYAANCLGITRQLHFSPRSEKSLDVTLSLNGIPVATVELKNPLTHQTVEDARRQYQRDRDPREPIFTFKRRTLAHFAVDTDSVLMATRLAGKATQFLPFNKGCAGRAGNPPDPAGRSYRTAWLWEEVLQRDGLLDILARFMHLQVEEKRDDRGNKVKAETMIFPRYHQIEAVRLLVDAAGREGPGHNYLVEHSAGSGKSNTIGWLAHRLASLHDTADERVFDSVIVITDRVVLDQQLQDTIYQFEHKRGVVQRIDKSSRQLAEALESAVPIVVTTLQKFPFVSRQLLRMAEERGADGTGTLPTRRCAVIVDEAHSSQGGETATDLKEVLGGERLREEAGKRAAEEGREDMEALFRSMAKRGRQANLSFFAFTATPKHKTLAVFGRDGKPVHRYTMRQAIEEGVHPRRAQALHHVRDVLPPAQGMRGRPRRGAQEGGAGAGPLHETASPQHRAEDRGDGRALPGRHPPPDRRPGQGDGGDGLASRSGALQAELRPLHRGEGLRHQVAGRLLRYGGGRPGRGRDLDRAGHEPRHLREGVAREIRDAGVSGVARR